MVGPVAAGHRPAPPVQRGSRRPPGDRRRVLARLSGPRPRDPGAGRLDRRNRGPRRPAGGVVAGPGRERLPHPPPAALRVQGGRPGRGRAPGPRRVSAGAGLGLRTPAGSRQEAAAALPGAARRDGSGPLGSPQRRHQLAHARAEPAARRALLLRARRTLPGWSLLQLQRHRRHVAAPLPRGRGRMAGGHPHRGPRRQLPCADAGLALRLPRGHRGSRGVAGPDRGLRDPAAAVVPGGDSDGAQAPPGTAARPLAALREEGGGDPSVRARRLPAHAAPRAPDLSLRPGPARAQRGGVPLHRPGHLLRGNHPLCHLLHRRGPEAEPSLGGPAPRGGRDPGDGRRADGAGDARGAARSGGTPGRFRPNAQEGQRRVGFGSVPEARPRTPCSS